jgi:hypothetical protein
MIKRGLLAILVLSVLFSFGLVFAQDADPIGDSYQCLEKSLGDDCGGSKNTEQTAFNLLAISYDSNLQTDCISALNEKKNTNCWGDTDNAACNVRITSIATLALNSVEEDVDNSLTYLKSNSRSETELTWFLQIDANNKTECTINGQKIIIQDDKKVTGSNPSGLTKAFGNYWFKINDINKNYTISCDLDFISSLLFQKPGSTVYHISSNTHNAPAFDSTTESVNSHCFTAGGVCNYEASLWASFALAKSGEEISKYIPYLTAFADEGENKKYLPSAFLYILTGEDDYYSELIRLQKSGKFWDESRRKFYDTSIALLALSNIGLEEVESSKRYLISVREPNNCWSELTSFLLYSGWPKVPAVTGRGGGGVSECEPSNFCVQIGNCESEKTLPNLYCSGLSEICCDSLVLQPTCIEQDGKICGVDEQCSGLESAAADTNYCCLSECEEIEDSNECEDAGYNCFDSCGKGMEEEAVYSDSCFGQFCCKQEAESGNNYLLIILLVILIILVILAIIFRNQLKVFLFKSKNKFKQDNVPPGGRRPGPPGFPPPIVPGRGRRVAPSQTHRMSTIPRRPKTDKDFDDTMKKLRDMSK